MTQHTKLFCLPLTAALMCCTVIADDITTSEGKTYHGVTVNRAEPDGLLLTYQPEGGGIGIAKVKFAVLPEKLQREYGYDAQKSAAFESDQARAQGVLRAKFLADHAAAIKRGAERVAREEAEWFAAQSRAAEVAAAAELVAKAQAAHASQIPYDQFYDTRANANAIQQWNQAQSQGASSQPAVQRAYVLRPLPRQNQSPANVAAIQRLIASQPQADIQLPDDVRRQILNSGAERGVATGSPGSPNANAATQEALRTATANYQRAVQSGRLPPPSARK